MASKSTLLAATILLAFLTVPSFGQAADPGQNGQAQGQGQGGGRGRGRFDPTEMRKQFLDRLKTDLGSTDDEFQALQPKIEKVLTARREADAGRFGGGFGGRRGRGGPNGGTPGGGDANAQPAASAQPDSAVRTASDDLRKTLDNKDSKPEEIKAKLDALRDAKTKAKADLTAAQTDLKGVLTQRQEAVLVEAGLLE